MYAGRLTAERGTGEGALGQGLRPGQSHRAVQTTAWTEAREALPMLGGVAPPPVLSLDVGVQRHNRARLPGSGL